MGSRLSRDARISGRTVVLLYSELSGRTTTKSVLPFSERKDLTRSSGREHSTACERESLLLRARRKRWIGLVARGVANHTEPVLAREQRSQLAEETGRRNVEVHGGSPLNRWSGLGTARPVRAEDHGGNHDRIDFASRTVVRASVPTVITRRC